MKHYIIPVFIPHYGCRHACVFCNQRRITGVETDVTPARVSEILEWHLARIDRARIVEIAFYGGSFTALPPKMQRALLAPAADALRAGRVQGIRLSTRPDSISTEGLALLLEHGVSVVELGVQSLSDAVLVAAERGHTAQDVEAAVRRIRRTPLQLGLQLMPGLPGEDWRRRMETLARAIALRPDFARIYPTVVLAGTKLAALYGAGAYAPLALEEAVASAAIMKLLFERDGIRVIRTGLQDSEALRQQGAVLAGPYHPAFGEMVDAFLFDRLLTQFFESAPPRGKALVVTHHPGDASKLRGLKNVNLGRWQAAYGYAQMRFRPTGARKRAVTVEMDGLRHCLSWDDIAHI